MTPRSGRTILFAVLVPFVVLASAAALALDDPDLVGSWRAQNVLVSADEVLLVLHLRVFNQGGTDLAEATVRVSDPVVPGFQDHPAFTQVAIPVGESVDLSDDMVVARAVYESWLAGGQPSVEVEFTGSFGSAVSLYLDLVPEP
jgi:hypothetical protein